MTSSPVYTALYASNHNYKDETALKSRRNLYRYTEPKFNIYAEVIDEIRKHNPKSVLDVACGYGDMLISLRQDYHFRGRLVGIDASAGIMKAAKEHVKTKGLKITFKQADAQALPFADNNFDCVSCNFALYAFEHIAQALSEIHRVLKPGGTCIITLHQKGNRPRVLEYTQILAELLNVEAPHLPQDRINLDTVQPFLQSFSNLEFKRFEGVITLKKPGPFVDYLKTLRDHIFYPEPTPEEWEQALKQVKPMIQAEIESKGSFQEITKVGFVSCRKAG